MAALRRKDLAVTYSAIDMINSLMHSVNSDHDLKQEQLNKSSILSSKTFLETLLNMWTAHVVVLKVKYMRPDLLHHFYLAEPW